MDLQDYVDIAREEGFESGLAQGRIQGIKEEQIKTMNEKQRADSAEEKLEVLESRINELEQKLAKINS